MVPSELGRKMRGSYYNIGALLGRCSKAIVPLPGGCDFGVRPIDQHIKGFKALGCTYSLNDGMIEVSAKELRGAHIYLDMVTVGATMNIILARRERQRALRLLRMPRANRTWSILLTS
mgnify:CR=1 FL=1